MGKLKVLINNNQDVCKVPTGMRLVIKRCCKAVLQMEQFNDDVEVSVSFVDNNQIKKLNAEYRNKDIETDVLSFQMCEGDKYDKDAEGVVILGDIVISFEKAVKQAHEYNHSIFRELAYLTVHSMLHLLNYEHENGGLEAVRMREKEETILNKIGLTRDATYVIFDDEN